MEKLNEIVVYQPDEIVNLEVRVENESVWLSLTQIAMLFDRDKSVTFTKKKSLSKIQPLQKMQQFK